MEVIAWSQRGRIATAEGMMIDSYSIDQFLNQECLVDTSSESATSANAIYRSYLLFSKEKNFLPVSSYSFSVHLEDMGIKRNRSQFIGVLLRDHRFCDYPNHHIYDGKKMVCPECKHEKISVHAITHGINKRQQLMLETKTFGRALNALASAAREYVVGLFIN